MKSRYIMQCCGFIQTSGRPWIPLLTIMLFVVLVTVTVVRLVYQSRIESSEIMTEDIQRLAEIIMRINERCKILDVDLQKTPIDFLTVAKFVGSHVGSINLAYPERWEGPYLHANPTIQGKEYQIVRTKKGYFITPGDGVILTNGKMVGKDIILDEDADIRTLMKSDQAFKHKDGSLAMEIPIKKGMLHELLFEDMARNDEDLLY
jgi:hypothetical protein